MSEQDTDQLYIGYIQLPMRNCRLRFVLEEEARAEGEKDVPILAFCLALAMLAVLIGLGGALLLMPYGGLVCG